MTAPETTSVAHFVKYVGGKYIAGSRGNAWRDIKAWIIQLPPSALAMTLPAVSEPFLALTLSGEVAFDEREGKGPWTSHRLKEGSFFLTSGGAPYECRWRSLSSKPFQTLLAFIELPLLERAFREVFRAEAPYRRLRDLSAFTDTTLAFYMQQLRRELYEKKASALAVTGIAQITALHLARHYAEPLVAKPSGSPSLPGYKVEQITRWLAEHLAEEFNLDRVAAQVGISKFYFERLFNNAMAMTPLQYQIELRLEEARRRLRETSDSIVDIAASVG